MKQLNESRNEFGVPVMSKIPLLDRLFRNVGINRVTTSVMLMVTPRIIILEEEEERSASRRSPSDLAKIAENSAIRAGLKTLEAVGNPFPTAFFFPPATERTRLRADRRRPAVCSSA